MRYAWSFLRNLRTAALPDRATPTPDSETEQARETRQAQAVLARAEFDVRTVCLVVLTGLALFYTLYFAAEIVLPIALALVLMLLLSTPMRFLTNRLHLPRVLAALLLIIALACVVGGIAMAVEPQIADWVQKAPQSLPKLQQSLSGLRGPIDRLRRAVAQLGSLMGPGGGQASPAPTGGMLGGMGGAVLSGTRTVVGQLFTIVLVLFFLLSAGDGLMHRFIEVLPSFGDKKRAVKIAHEIEENISKYLATITMMNALVGVLNGVQAWAIGLPGPLLWGMAAFLLNYVPILGPLTGVVLFFFVALFTLSSAWYALVPAGIYLLIHLLEGETITPMLLARRFTLNPLLVILSLLFWDWMWGVPGAFLSVPLLAVLKIFCDQVEALTPIGHMLGADHARPKRG